MDWDRGQIFDFGQSLDKVDVLSAEKEKSLFNKIYGQYAVPADAQARDIARFQRLHSS